MTETNAVPESKSPTLHRTIGAWQVMFYGLGSMLGAGIYGLIGKAAGTLGNAVWLAFLVAMIAALLTGLSYACVGSRYPRAAGASYVTHHALGVPWLSYVVGLAVLMSGLTSMAAGLQVIADNLAVALDWRLPSKWVAIALAVMVGGIIYRGIRESMWVNIVCTIVEASGLLFIIIVGLRYWGGVDYLETANDTVAGGPGSGLTLAIIMQGAVLTFFSFIGFEDVLNIGEEVKNPRRNMPLGLLGAMVLGTCIYIAVAITAVSVIPWRELAASSTPLMEVAHRAAPWFKGIDSVFIGITIFAVGNTAMLNYIMGSRLLYGMSKQGLMPEVLAKVHPRRRTPHVAIAVLFVIVAGLILNGGVKQLAEATALLLLTVFTVVNISLVVLKRRPGEPKGGFEVPYIVPILGALVCALLVFTRIHDAMTSEIADKSTAPLIALAIIVISLGLYVVLRPKNVVTDESEDL